jgi:hypothetical protein
MLKGSATRGATWQQQMCACAVGGAAVLCCYKVYQTHCLWCFVSAYVYSDER